jgi:hypothetical protein
MRRPAAEILPGPPRGGAKRWITVISLKQYKLTYIV